MVLEQDKDPERKKIPVDQWDLAIGIDSNGNEITLKQVDKSALDIHSVHGISKEIANLQNFNPKELALARLRKVENYGTFRLPEVGKIDKQKAIQLIEENHKVADYLIQLEMKTIQLMVKRLKPE